MNNKYRVSFLDRARLIIRLFCRRAVVTPGLLGLLYGVNSLSAFAQSAGAASAADAGAGFKEHFRQGPVETILHCGALGKETARLACLDAAYRFFTARDAHQVDHALVETGNGDRSPPSRSQSYPSGVNDAASGTASSKTVGGINAETAGTATGNEETVHRRGLLMTREVTLDDIELPLETRITAFNMNWRGDFLLEIEEGWVFKRASGPLPPSDLTGQSIVLEKNFLGNWRIHIPSRVKPLWVKPVEDSLSGRP